MAATKSKIKEDICKWCKRAFETTPNPLVANPGAGDLLKRRCANGRDCRPCFVFIKNHDVYKEYTTSGLVDFLGEGSNQDDYNAALEEYCKGVRDGKKRTRSRGESKAVAEQSNSFATKQILGYLWPVPLLKRHERPIPKKLTTIQHQGKPLKGALLEEWVIGAVEVASTSAKTAKQIHEIADGGSSDDDNAAEAFEAASKKVRVSAIAKDDELSLKMPVKASNEDDELMNMLWGGSSFGGASDDAENSAPVKKKVRTASTATPRARGAQSSQDQAAPSAASGQQSETQSDGGARFTFSMAGGGKKSAAETRELDKSETLVLQSNQLKHQVEDARGVMNVSLTKTNCLLDKVDSRLNESTKSFMEMIRVQGTGCRAETVWQSLKDARSMLQAVADFLEALQDKEAAPETLGARAQVLRDLKISIPLQINNVICQRTLVSMFEDEKFGAIVEFLDPGFAEVRPEGIKSVIGESVGDEASLPLVKEFQAGCVAYVINQFFLRHVCAPSDSIEKKNDVTAGFSKLMRFLYVFHTSPVAKTCAGDKSALKDDLLRLTSLLQVATSDPSAVNLQDAEAAEQAKSILIKGKNTFQTAITIYPAGVFLAETVSKLTSKLRQDAALVSEIQGAAEFAGTLKAITRDSIMKERADGSDVEVSIPQQSKFADMVAKFVCFEEKASDDAKKECSAALSAIQERIKQLHDALLELAAFKFEKKFPDFEETLGMLVAGKVVEGKATDFLQLLGDIVGYQCFPKLNLLKVLGKDLAAKLEASLSSVQAVCRSMQAAASKLITLASDSVDEGLLLEERLVSLFSTIAGVAMMSELEAVLPKWATSVTAVKHLIEGSVTKFMKASTATVHKFVVQIMETEINLEAVLQTGVVGTMDMDDKEGKSGLDYANLYLAYISKMSSLVEIDGCSEDRKVQVHVSFLCLAGSLLGLSKYMVMFREKIDEAQEMKPFKQIVDEEFEVRKAKTKMTQIFKMQLVAQVGTHLAKFASPITSYLNMINKMNDTDKEQDYFNKIMGKMSTYVVQLLSVCNDELGCMSSLLHNSFKAMQADHDFPGIFQKEHLDKNAISCLVGSASTQYILFVGTKSSAICEDIKLTLEAVRVLPKDLILTPAVMTMLTALGGDLNRFGSCSQQGPPKDGDKIMLAHFSYFQGSMTLGQCLTRDLNPGETRLGLTKRCLEILSNKGMLCEGNLKKNVESLSAGK